MTLRKIPNTIKDEIYKEVVAQADIAGYGNINRAESNRFIDTLTNDPAIGGKISSYLKKDKVRTYIKDSLLNRYTKKLNSVPQNVTENIKEIFGKFATELDYEKTNRVSLHKFEDQANHFLVVSRGTFIKWETAVRKALNYIICSPIVNINNSSIKILLVIIADNRSLTNADKEALKRALDIIDVHVSFTSK